MEYDSGVLTQNMIYEAAEISIQTTPLEQIKYIGLTDQYTDLTILTKLSNLRILTFRLCALQFFPDELFQLKSLQVIDLSGNQIPVLPDNEKFSALVNLYQLNLSDNKISNINEIYKLDTLTNLKILNLTGNVCLSYTNSFDLITDIFPKLIVLNEYIITSQYRAYLLSFTNLSGNALIPISKADDYIFFYSKFLRSPTSDRYIRRSLAENFCLTKVIRHFSYIEKIQSVFRGFLQRRKYDHFKQTTKYVHNFLKFWFQKRKNAANKIQRTFLHFQLRKRIKEVVSARLIQSVWRGFTIRRLCLLTIFERDQKIVFYVTSPHLRQLKNFLRKRNFPFPDEEETSNFRKIRIVEPKKQRFPGSPLIYYTIDNSSLIRPFKVKKPSKDSIWCRHDHTFFQAETVVSREGVNFSPRCHFCTISYKPYTKPIKPSKVPTYDSFVRCTYNDRAVFQTILTNLLVDPPQRLRLFNEETVKTISSLLVVQSSCRTFLVRSRLFRSIKKRALEERSSRCIRLFVHSTFFRKSVTHSLDVLHYFRSISDSNVFYITKRKLEKICLAKVPTKYQVKFGYSSDRFVLIEKGKMQLPMLFVPTGKIIFTDQDLPSLFKLGVSSTKVLPSMFKNRIPSKWLRRTKFVRLTFKNPDEARIRIALYSYLTMDFKSVMDEKEVVQFCAANSIKNAWIGFIMRKTIMHIGAQAGKKLNLLCLIRHNISEKKKKKKKKKKNLENDEYEYYYDYDDDDSCNSKKKSLLNYNDNDSKNLKLLKRNDLSPDDAITILRSDYKPWLDDFKKFKELNSDSSQKVQESSIVDPVPTNSMFQMGLVNDLENAFAQTNPSDQQKTKKITLKKTAASLTFSKKVPIKKPLVASLRFPKKPCVFQIELETQKIFAPKLHKIQQINLNNKKIEKFRFSAPLPDLIHPNTPVDIESQSFESSTEIAENNQQKKLKIRKPLFEEINSKSGKKQNDFEKNQNQIRVVFTKLVRLRQVGIQIMEATMNEKIFDENKSKANETRESIEFLRIENNLLKENELKNLRERSQAEKNIYKRERQENESRASKKRNIKIHNLKNEIESKNHKNSEQKNFAQNFVTFSAKLASNSEKVKLPKNVNLVAVDKNDSLNKFRIQQSQIKKNKQEASKWSKFLNDQKLEKSKISHSEKIDRISKLKLNEIKKKSKMASVQKINNSLSFCESPLLFDDPIHRAAKFIGNFVGENIGEVESLLLSEIIKNIVE